MIDRAIKDIRECSITSSFCERNVWFSKYISVNINGMIPLEFYVTVTCVKQRDRKYGVASSKKGTFRVHSKIRKLENNHRKVYSHSYLRQNMIKSRQIANKFIITNTEGS